MPVRAVDAATLHCWLDDGSATLIHRLKGGRGASACEKLLRQNPAHRQVQLTIGISPLFVLGAGAGLG
jgi:hypothetical protein